MHTSLHSSYSILTFHLASKILAACLMNAGEKFINLDNHVLVDFANWCLRTSVLDDISLNWYYGKHEFGSYVTGMPNLGFDPTFYEGLRTIKNNIQESVLGYNGKPDGKPLVQTPSALKSSDFWGRGLEEKQTANRGKRWSPTHSISQRNLLLYIWKHKNKWSQICIQSRLEFQALSITGFITVVIVERIQMTLWCILQAGLPFSELS